MQKQVQCEFASGMGCALHGILAKATEYQGLLRTCVAKVADCFCRWRTKANCPIWFSSIFSPLVCTHHAYAHARSHACLPCTHKSHHTHITDICESGASCLPASLPTTHNQVLRGPYVLQVDEVLDVSEGHEKRYVCQNSLFLLSRSFLLPVTPSVLRQFPLPAFFCLIIPPSSSSSFPDERESKEHTEC